MSPTKARPILMSAPMVRALLAGEKTQTRRAVKLPALIESDFVEEAVAKGGAWEGGADGYGGIVAHVNGGRLCIPLRCPYGGVGDRLWVRETWASKQTGVVAYRADGECGAWTGDGGGGRFWLRHGGVFHKGIPMRHDSWRGQSFGLSAFGGRWRPSIFMPRWASRITLEITDVRVQRLQEIGRADAKAEGFPNSDGSGLPSSGGRMFGNAELAFRDTWGSINGAGSWDLNPWVWCLSFRRVPG